MVYEPISTVDHFAAMPVAMSEMLLRVAEGFHGIGARIGASATDIRIVAGGRALDDDACRHTSPIRSRQGRSLTLRGADFGQRLLLDRQVQVEHRLQFEQAAPQRS